MKIFHQPSYEGGVSLPPFAGGGAEAQKIVSHHGHIITSKWQIQTLASWVNIHAS